MDVFNVESVVFVVLSALSNTED